jgi:mRNA interferase HicA
LQRFSNQPTRDAILRPDIFSKYSITEVRKGSSNRRIWEKLFADVIQMAIFVCNKNEVKYSEIEKKLKKAGCYLMQRGGKHPVWYSPITGRAFTTSHHKSEEAKLGTLKSISKQSGVKF